MKISIIMTYFNRKEQCMATLRSMSLTAYPHEDFDIQIIDDVSAPEHRLEDLVDKYPLNIKIIRVEKEEHKWAEPLAPMNKTIRECQSKAILFQFTECLHVGDIVSRAMELIQDGVYITFACFSLDNEWSKRLRALPTWSREEVLDLIPPEMFLKPYPIGWWNHSVISPRHPPFCIAFMKEDYISMGGFDEEFADGICGSDDDFMDRCELYYNKVLRIDDPFVIHQYHPRYHYMRPNSVALEARNTKLLAEKRARRNK